MDTQGGRGGGVNWEIGADVYTPFGNMYEIDKQ